MKPALYITTELAATRLPVDGGSCTNHPDVHVPATMKLYRAVSQIDDEDEQHLTATADGWTFTGERVGLCPNCSADAYERVLNMTLIAQFIVEGGQHAYVEMTGGGCATIYAGPTHIDPKDPDYGPRYALVAGPGVYGKESYAEMSDICYGLDDSGESPVVYIGQRIHAERPAADEMLAFLSLTSLPEFRYIDGAFGFTHEATAITDPTIDHTGRFAVEPDYYGLSKAQADALTALNAHIAKGSRG